MGLRETGSTWRDGRTPWASYLPYQPVSRASSSGAARTRAYTPNSTMVDFIGEVCHPAGDPARGPRLRVRQDLGQDANNGRLYLKVCHVTPIPPEPPKEHRYANNSNLSIDVEHTI